jgi:TonB family protein
LIAILAIFNSCEQEKADPALILDEVFIPEGYHQIETPPVDISSRLEELRLKNPTDHYYYLQRNETHGETWIFPQKELKIEYVAYSEASDTDNKAKVDGVIVKKIQGNWKDEKFLVVESQPAPSEGLNAFYHYIQENLKYPELAKKEGIQGKVFVEFIVDETGRFIEVKAVKGIGAGCDEEAVRVIKKAPKWIPAKINNEPVKVKMILPVTYKLG